MIFVDTNVVMYAVGNPHPLQGVAREFFDVASSDGTPLCTSTEVLQELAHAYLRVNRRDSFEDALALLARFAVTIWPLTDDDVILAVELHAQHPDLSARDLCHLASCRRRGVTRIRTFDQGLAAAAGRRGGTAAG